MKAFNSQSNKITRGDNPEQICLMHNARTLCHKNWKLCPKFARVQHLYRCWRCHCPDSDHKLRQRSSNYTEKAMEADSVHLHNGGSTTFKIRKRKTKAANHVTPGSTTSKNHSWINAWNKISIREQHGLLSLI
jgi:hypothetical protein